MLPRRLGASLLLVTHIALVVSSLPAGAPGRVALALEVLYGNCDVPPMTICHLNSSAASIRHHAALLLLEGAPSRSQSEGDEEENDAE